MDIRSTSLALALAACLAPCAAAAGDPFATGAMPVPANRIVGVWDNAAYVGPCGGTPSATPARQTVVFHAGGTFLDNARYPPQGIATPNGTMQRSIGVGSWEYSPRTGRWSLEQRFDFFKNNVYDGYQVISRSSILLSSDGKTMAGPVHAYRYDAAGTLVLEQCGTATATRL